MLGTAAYLTPSWTRRDCSAAATTTACCRCAVSSPCVFTKCTPPKHPAGAIPTGRSAIRLSHIDLATLSPTIVPALDVLALTGPFAITVGIDHAIVADTVHLPCPLTNGRPCTRRAAARSPLRNTPLVLEDALNDSNAPLCLPLTGGIPR